VIKPKSNPCVIEAAFRRAKKRGTNAIQASHPEPYLGKDKNNKRPLKTAKKTASLVNALPLLNWRLFLVLGLFFI
jgi:hypothetical protein